MNKSSHFIGQPAYGQLINLLDKEEILEISRTNGGERYVKHFNAWQHLLIMLYAIIKRLDSLREITDSMFPEARKLTHLVKSGVQVLLWRKRKCHQDTGLGHTYREPASDGFIQKRIKRRWSFSGLATMVRIMLNNF